MEMLVVYFIMGALMAYVLYLTFRGRNLGVVNPTLGFLNVGGDGFIPLIEEDRTALSPLFSNVETAAGYQIPKCSVLFIYADVRAGRLDRTWQQPHDPASSRTSGCLYRGARVEQFFGTHDRCIEVTRAETRQSSVDA